MQQRDYKNFEFSTIVLALIVVQLRQEPCTCLYCTSTQSTCKTLKPFSLYSKAGSQFNFKQQKNNYKVRICFPSEQNNHIFKF